MTSTDIVGIDLFPSPSDDLSTRVRRAGQAKALVSFAKEIEGQARDDLQREIEQVTELTGEGGFSKKVDGIRATLTDPQPRPRISDQDAFGQWWAEQGLEHEVREYVEAHSPGTAARALEIIESPTFADDHETIAAAARDLAACLSVGTEYVLPSKPLDQLVESGRAIVRGDADQGWVLLDPSSGEQVPGVDVDPPGKPVIQVVPDKPAKARDVSIVRSFFGLAPEVGGAS